MGKNLSEQQVEQAALGRFEALDFDVAQGADISPGADSPLRDSFDQAVLEPRLRSALRKINPRLPEEVYRAALVQFKQDQTAGAADYIDGKAGGE